MPKAFFQIASYWNEAFIAQRFASWNSTYDFRLYDV